MSHLLVPGALCDVPAPDRSRLSTQIVMTSAGVTIAVLPWLLGSAIPHAMFVLLAGTTLTAILTLAACFSARRLPRVIPKTAWPLIGLLVIGGVQLLPVFRPTVLQMRHAINPGSASGLPTVVVRTNRVPGQIPEEGTTGEIRTVRSVLPDQTRYRIAHLSALVVLAVCVSSVVSTPRDILGLTWLSSANACAMAVIALSQRLDGTGPQWVARWKVSSNPGYGCFVNPNNAAAWLLTSFGLVLFVANHVWFRESRGAQRREAGIAADRRFRSPLVLVLRRLGTASAADAGMLVAVTLMIAAIIGSLSRSGGLALMTGMVTYAICLRSWRKMLWFALGIASLLTPVALILFQLDYETQLRKELASLTSPVSQFSIRFQHWRDSLMSVWDFGWLGSGLGGYRYASLPYQSRYTANWFQHADNQFVEVVVESGIPGLICFLSPGICALVVSWRAAAGSSHAGRSGHNAAVRNFARSVWFTVPALAVSAFFDYGTWLPAVSGLFVLQIAALESVSRFSAGSTRTTRAPARRRGLTFLPGGTAVLLTCLGIVVASLPETLAATRLHPQIASMERMVERPDPHSLTESGLQLSVNVTQALNEHPDWFEARRVLMNFVELQYRQAILSRLTRDHPLKEEQHIRALRSLDPFEVACRLLKGRPGTVAHEAFLSAVDASLREYPWITAARSLMNEHPLMPSVARKLMATEIAPINGAGSGPQPATMRHLLFVHPSDAAAFAEMGSLLQQTGHQSAARIFWKRSLAISSRFLPDILGDAAAHYGVPAAIDLFAPTDFDACLSAAIRIGPKSLLGTTLLARCDRIWTRSGGKSGNLSVPSRVRQLALMGRSAEAIRLVDEALGLEPMNVPLRKAKADALEWSGNFQAAYDEWLRIRLFSPTDSDFPGALNRLSKPDTRSRPRNHPQKSERRLPGL